LLVYRPSCRVARPSHLLRGWRYGVECACRRLHERVHRCARTHARTHALTHSRTLSPSCPPTDALSRPPSLPLSHPLAHPPVARSAAATHTRATAVRTGHACVRAHWCRRVSACAAVPSSRRSRAEAAATRAPPQTPRRCPRLRQPADTDRRHRCEPQLVRPSAGVRAGAGGRLCTQRLET
jgi:hypothetical protein